MEMETPCETNSLGIGHNTMKKSQKPLEDLQA
jgi:hypothetical protein